MRVTFLFCLLSQISYGSSTPTLSDRNMFPRFFRTIPSEVQSNSARFALMLLYNWERVATLHETQNIFSLVGRRTHTHSIKQSINRNALLKTSYVYDYTVYIPCILRMYFLKYTPKRLYFWQHEASV